MLMDEAIDLGGQFLHAPECAPADGLLGNDVVPDLHLVQPGGIGRRQMDVELGMQGQPVLHPGMLMSCVAIDDQMNVRVSGDIRVDILKEVEILLTPVPLLAPGENLAGSDIERGIGGHGYAAGTVGSHTSHKAKAHRQSGRSPAQSLTSALLVDTEDQGVLQRVQAQADSVTDNFDRKAIDLETAMAFSSWAPCLESTIRFPVLPDLMGYLLPDRPMKTLTIYLVMLLKRHRARRE